MEAALAEAACADFATSPNPMVGAVVVREGRIVGRGHHHRAGQPHAEVEALRDAGAAAAGATMYVTLEPCTTHGRTPPCVGAIVGAGIGRVVVAIRDPNPAVDGAGLAALRGAGIDVALGVGAAGAHRLTAFYATWIRTGRPFVTVKFAASLDGRIATRTGGSRWISSEESRRRAHRLRHEHDAVIVGAGTVAADDPELTVRDHPRARQPVRVVVDSRLRTSPRARLLSSPGGPVLVATTSAAPKERRGALVAAGAEVLTVGGDARVDLDDLLDLLGRRNLISVLVEGGPTLAGSLVDARAVDRVVAFIAPLLIGGESAPAAIAGGGVARLADALRLEDVSVDRSGGDIVVSGYCVR
ncbi:MAG: bifunctional diaminohydroxyphosphoribosylaminopyrimidine deaminase/5-amino-6-(5-phosphoribosylamino)uracil reductase RibD [Candidatus Dormibacteria bacterium]